MKKFNYILNGSLALLLVLITSLFLFPHVDNKKSNEITPVKEKVNYKDKIIKKELIHNPSNRITIDGVLDNRIMDDDGSYYYLDHNLDGVADQTGMTIIDFRTNFETRKTILYAHSTIAGNGPFQALQNYANNKEYYENHKYINIKYNDKDYKYEIFSVYLSLAEDRNSEELEYFYNTEYLDVEWERIIKKYKNKSQYDTGVEVNKDDKILILQTCSMDPDYYEKYYRYNILIMAKQI